MLGKGREGKGREGKRKEGWGHGEGRLLRLSGGGGGGLRAGHSTGTPTVGGLGPGALKS